LTVGERYAYVVKAAKAEFKTAADPVEARIIETFRRRALEEFATIPRKDK
jgi:hypothetical protein